MADKVLISTRGASSISGVAGDISTVIQTELDKNTISSGVVASAPLGKVGGNVWIKGKIAYVNLVMEIPSGANLPLSVDFPLASAVKIASGLPPAPGAVGNANEGVLIGALRNGRATWQGGNRVAPCQVTADGSLLIATGGQPLLGSTTAGQSDYLTISGNYIVN